MTIKLYIAGKYTSAGRLEGVAKDMRQIPNVEIVSTWHTSKPPLSDLQEAIRDLQELSVANVFIIDTLDESSTGGREVELGYMLARYDHDPMRLDTGVLGVGLVGPIRNVFHNAVSPRFDGWQEAAGWVTRLAAR